MILKESSQNQKSEASEVNKRWGGGVALFVVGLFMWGIF